MSEYEPELIARDKTTFGDVLGAISAENKLNQYQLAVKTGYSQPAISRIEKGKRSLTANFAEKLAQVLGGTQEKWLKVHDETKGGSNLPVVHFRDQILGNSRVDALPGTRIRRMRDRDILAFFGDNPDGVMQFRGVEEECEIADFDKRRVQKTSYDTRIGGIIDAKNGTSDAIEQVVSSVVIPAGESLIVCVKEHITLPSWLEADIHPASNIGLKGLIVSHGPIVDPGWSGFLCVSVFNPTKEDQEITIEEPFLTLRFWMQDGH